MLGYAIATITITDSRSLVKHLIHILLQRTNTRTKTKSKMDPLIPASFNHRIATLSTGNTYHFIDQVPEGLNERAGKTKQKSILCIHGFPDLW